MTYRALLMFVLSCVLASKSVATTPDAVIERIGSAVFVAGQFTQQKQLAGVSYALKANGHFYFWQTQGLYLHTEAPFFSAFTVAKDGLIQWDADGVGRLANDQSAIFQREFNKTLLAFFRADLALIEQRFHASWSFSESGWELVLVPKLSVIEAVMTRVELRGDALLNEMTVIGANGDSTQLSFAEQTVTPAPTPAQCRWFFLTSDAHCESLAASH